MKYPLYRALAVRVEARANCLAAPQNEEWARKHREAADVAAADHLPSGSGFDSGTTIDWDRSKPNRLVLSTSFHHMDENGTYDGWTEHSVIVTPSLTASFELRVTGPNRNDIKDYIAETFHTALSYVVEG
jgi:hypothetical protein